jgi:SAM-dependent methyltransferase
MSNQKQPHKARASCREYWDANLDHLNIRRPGAPSTRNLKEEIVFYETPEHLYARRLMGTIAGKRILELGAGLSVHPIILARAGARIIIADFSLERLKRTRSLILQQGLADTILLVCCAAESLALASQTVDIVYTKSVLIHTRLQEAALEIRRSLKPQGSGIFIEPLRWNPFAALYRALLAPPEWRSITTYFDRRRIALLRETFGNLDNRRFYLFSFLAFYWQFARRNFRTFSTALRVLLKVDRLLFRLLPFLRRFCWLTVIRVRKQNEH